MRTGEPKLVPEPVHVQLAPLMDGPLWRDMTAYGMPADNGIKWLVGGFLFHRVRRQ